MSMLTILFNHLDKIRNLSKGSKIILIVGILLLLIISIILAVLIRKPQEIQLATKKATYFLPSQYALDQVLIKYRTGYSPEELQDAILERENEKNKIGGPLKIFWKDNVLKQKSPEELLKELNRLDEKAGVISKRKLFEGTNDAIFKRHYLLELKPGSDVIEVENLYLKYNFIENTEPNMINQAFATKPNDTFYSQMWGLQKIDMPNAWDITKGSDSIIVAVVDTGIDNIHPDLQGKVISGFNFISGNNDPMDDAGHGTHVAGTIGATTNNGIGVSGINWNIRLMPVKVLNSSGSGLDVAIFSGIKYAADNGAKVINMSLGTPQKDRFGNILPPTPCSSLPQYQDAINYALGKGTVIVVAAGNDDLDASGSSPASCTGVITVGATTPTDSRARFSNYESTVEIAAPGTGIFSTILPGARLSSGCYDAGGGYGPCDGTSMATPHIAGAAALLLSVNSSLTSQQVRDCLVNNADPISTDKPIGKRLNVFKALQACSSGALPPIPTPTPTPIPTATPTLPPGTTPTPTPAPTLPPGTTPTPTGGGLGGASPTPSPTPIVPYNCVFDSSFCSGGKNLQLCRLFCTPR